MVSHSIESLLEVFDLLPDRCFEIIWQIDHRLFPAAGLPEVTRTVPEIIIRCAATSRVATLASHLDDGAVDESLGIGD